MEQLFTTLTHAVEGTAAIAMAAAFVWGVLSILLSPCHLASIPLIVGFIDQQGRISTRRAFTISLLFAVGILITIGAIGAITAAAGLHGRSRPRNHVDILRFIYGHRFLSPLKIGHPIVAQPLSLPAVSDCPVCQSQPRAR